MADAEFFGNDKAREVLRGNAKRRYRPRLDIPCYGQIVALCESSGEDPEEKIHVYDIVWMEENWIETEEGVLVPRNGVLMIAKEEHSSEKVRHLTKTYPYNVDFQDMGLISVIKPYITFLSSASNVRDHFGRLVTRNLSVDIASDPKSVYRKEVNDDSLVYASGLEAIALTDDLRPDYAVRHPEIIRFAERMLTGQ